MITINAKGRYVALISTLILLVISLNAVGSTATHDTAAQSIAVDNFWDTETLLVVKAISPHFDYLLLRNNQGEYEGSFFSFVEAATGDLRVAHWGAGNLEIDTVAQSQLPGALAGIGNDLALVEGTPVISYSQLKTDGSGAVAFAHYGLCHPGLLQPYGHWGHVTGRPAKSRRRTVAHCFKGLSNLW